MKAKVTIDLEEYNNLLELKKTMDAGKYTIQNEHGSIKFISIDQALIETAKVNEDLRTQLYDVKTRFSSLTKEFLVMSTRKFRQWRQKERDRIYFRYSIY